MEDGIFRVFKAFCDSFSESVVSMTGLEIKRLQPGVDANIEAPSFTVITGFKGTSSGSIIFKSSAAGILRLYTKYLGEGSDVINPDVIDGIKELSSIVNGAASAKEPAMKLTFTPSLTLFSEEMENHVATKAVGAAVSFFVEQCGVFTVEVHQ